MFRNYLAAALRNLVRNRLYAAINIIGLAIGFAAALLIALFVRDEVTYDQWIPGQQNVYTVIYAIGAQAQIGQAIPADFAAKMKQDFPAIQKAARLYSDAVSLRRDGFEGRQGVYWADLDFFSIVRLPVIAGDAVDALHRPDGIVLTRSAARKFFGRDTPLNETIELNRGELLTVGAVIEDLPSNTHLDYGVFLSGMGASSALSRMDAQAAEGFQLRVYTYLEIESPAAAQQIEAGMPAFFAHHRAALPGGFASFKILPIAKIHLSPANFRMMKPNGDVAVVVAVAGAGGLIVLLACINFVNLMTAVVARRATEVGVRKTSGAERRHLMIQFIGEAALYMALGTGFAGMLAFALLPRLNAFLGRTIAFPFDRPLASVALAATLGLLAVVAGFYPAVVLSSLPPAAALASRRSRAGAAAKVRQILVIVQFAVLIGLVIVAGIAYRQIQYATHEGMRLATDEVVEVLGGSCGNAFEDRVNALPGVRSSACSSVHALNIAQFTLGARSDERIEPSFNLALVDDRFFAFHHLAPLAGRVFSAALVSDKAKAGDARFEAPVVLNETAVRRLGFASAADAIGRSVTIGPAAAAATVIGVVPDFAFDSIRSPVAPTGYQFDPRQFQLLHLRLDGARVPETLGAIDRIWAEIGDPRPINRFFLETRVQEQYLDLTREAQVFAIFGAVAIFVAALGLFGLSAFTAERRTKEIGIRKAMGATRLDVLRLVVWEFTKPVLLANIVAWPLAYVIMKSWLERFAYHIAITPWMFIAASTLAFVIAVVTVMAHALMVACSQPVTALRYE